MGTRGIAANHALLGEFSFFDGLGGSSGGGVEDREVAGFFVGERRFGGA
jgi:hypothetical protein